MALKDTIIKLNEAIEQSKKLTTKDRKKMKKGTFCGPNRSFPVPDCKHVGAAKAYLNRSNFSAATKKRIASCINGKAKALGCTPGKPAKSKGSEFEWISMVASEEFWKTMQPIEAALADSEIFKTTKDLVEDSLKSEQPVELDFSEVEDED